jgi:hypothetical protein
MKEGLIPKDNHVNKGMSMVWKILIVVALALGAGGFLYSLTLEDGEMGLRGFNGIDGAAGLKGDTGTQGIKGDTGDQGVQGAQGIKGDTGDTAPNASPPPSP